MGHYVFPFSKRNCQKKSGLPGDVLKSVLEGISRPTQLSLIPAVCLSLPGASTHLVYQENRVGRWHERYLQRLKFFLSAVVLNFIRLL